MQILDRKQRRQTLLPLRLHFGADRPARASGFRL